MQCSAEDGLIWVGESFTKLLCLLFGCPLDGWVCWRWSTLGKLVRVFLLKEMYMHVRDGSRIPSGILSNNPRHNSPSWNLLHVNNDFVWTKSTCSTITV